MNLLFFLTPKATCCYLYADYTLRQAMERMEHSGYSALPILTREGTYCGTLTEGDLLWATKKLCCMDFRDTEEHSIMGDRPPARQSAGLRLHGYAGPARKGNGSELVPVVDDKGDFIGIVTRRAIMRYFLEQMRVPVGAAAEN